MHEFKIIQFLVSVRKVYELQKNPNQEMTLGVMVFALFPKKHINSKNCLLEVHQNAILGLLGTSRNYVYSQCFCESQKPGIPVAPVENYLYSL